MRKLGPQTKLPILWQVFDTFGDFKMRSFLFVSVALSSSVQAAASPGMWILSAAQDPVLLTLPPLATCQKITLETKAPVSMVTWRSIFPSIAWGIRRRKTTSFFCQNKFCRIGLKELHPDLISSIKSPVKPPELQRINKYKMWFYINVLITEMWNNILQTTCSDLLLRETQEWDKHE